MYLYIVVSMPVQEQQAWGEWEGPETWAGKEAGHKNGLATRHGQARHGLARHGEETTADETWAGDEEAWAAATAWLEAATADEWPEVETWAGDWQREQGPG